MKTGIDYAVACPGLVQFALNSQENGAVTACQCDLVASLGRGTFPREGKAAPPFACFSYPTEQNGILVEISAATHLRYLSQPLGNR